MAQKKTIFTKAKEIIVAVWEDAGASYPTSGDALNYVIADSLSITQDDPDENSIDCETSDSPILNNLVAGSVGVDLNNASIDSEFLTKVLGWVETTSPKGLMAPDSFSTRYIALQVKFDGTGDGTKYLFLPRIAVAPKLVFESLKTNVAYGTLSGTAESFEVGGQRGPMGLFDTAILTKTAE